MFESCRAHHKINSLPPGAAAEFGLSASESGWVRARTASGVSCLSTIAFKVRRQVIRTSPHVAHWPESHSPVCPAPGSFDWLSWDTGCEGCGIAVAALRQKHRDTRTFGWIEQALEGYQLCLG